MYRALEPRQGNIVPPCRNVTELTELPRICVSNKNSCNYGIEGLEWLMSNASGYGGGTMQELHNTGADYRVKCVLMVSIGIIFSKQTNHASATRISTYD